MRFVPRSWTFFIKGYHLISGQVYRSSETPPALCDQSRSSMAQTHSQRETVLAKIQRLVSEKYFDPKFDEALWNRIVDNHRKNIVDAESETAFETAVAAMLAEMA